MNTIKVSPITDPNIVRPLWSVMIPAYNCSNYLKETIQSVLCQDRGIENMEIWVVDDCSDDDPQQIVEESGKGRVHFYRQKQNVGQLNNFSTCLNLAGGKIIHLLHGDDFVHPGFYEKLETPLLSDDSIGAAFTRNHVVDENGKIKYIPEALKAAPGVIDDFVSIIASKQMIQTPAIVVKREVYEKIGAFNRDLTWIEDWEMWVRIACNFNFYYTPEILASYRIHSTSNTADSLKTGRFIKDTLKGINIFSAYLNFPTSKKREIINSAKQHFLNFAIQQSRLNASISILQRSFPLVYNYSSFIQLIKSLFTISIKSILGFKK